TICTVFLFILTLLRGQSRSTLFPYTTLSDLEEQQSIKGIAGDRIPEQGKASKVTGSEARSSFWIGIQEPPDGEIGHQEKLQGTEIGRASCRERGESWVGDG